ncbi:HrpE/YscL family type III secretion apparatus protein [Gemmobacter sp. 24YEA27]|uniref:HrpE/YscL family type III secretion apparatus protein n=1 Tax=Gemmobacter sp. 24YEA27 TaxID=3040672 RepID=UPI0024B3C0D0|nr:HrpE/YscL family type III secretion apparatus protein [Gemmobacter sp. 24YEA27]
MPLPQLEVFEAGRSPGRDVVITDTASVEENRAAAWEQGYRAGWDDSEAAHMQNGNRVRAELEQNLMTLDFTWQEARAHILGAMEPLLQEIVNRLLPDLARETLGPILVGQLMPMVAETAEQPANLTLHPAARPQVEALLSRRPGLLFEISEDPGLGESQVFLRLGAREVSINLSRVTESIIRSVQDFFTLSQENPDG